MLRCGEVFVLESLNVPIAIKSAELKVNHPFLTESRDPERPLYWSMVEYGRSMSSIKKLQFRTTWP